MSEHKERRYIDRKALPEATVYYRRISKVNFMVPFQGPARLIDISKSAMRLTGDMLFPRNARLQLKIRVPGQRDIFLKGRVSFIDPDRTYSIVQVLPFGYGPGYNSFHTKADLDVLLNRITDNALSPDFSDTRGRFAILSTLIRILTSQV